jgi:hypothetical protein
MKRTACIVLAAVLGVGFYLADPPRLPAESTIDQPRDVMTTAPQSEVGRLAEASLAMRQKGQPEMAGYPEPRPEALFGKK